MADIQVLDAIILRANEDGSCKIERVEIEDSLDTLQAIVCGNIEAVYLDRTMHDKTHGYINDEGKLLGLPVNPTATSLAWAFGYIPPFEDFIVGDMVILGDGGEGTEADCPDWVYSVMEAIENGAD